MLIVSVAILTASLLLQLRTTGEVALTWLPETSLPPLCVSRTMLGVECPGCGLTRSFVALSSGDFVESFRLHRVGWLIYVSVVLQIPYRTYKLHKLRQTEAAWQAIDQETWLVWFGRFLIAALIVNWLLRMGGV